MPFDALNVCPSTVEPLTAGATVFAGGGGVTVAVAAEVAGVEPPALLAVTTTRSVCPTSPAASL